MADDNYQDMTDAFDFENSDSGKGKQGFASMDKNRQKTIASKGGRAAHEQGTAHEWDSAEAKDAGQKGGRARAANMQEEDL